MKVELAGTGGPAGWPQPGCSCASCSGARHTGVARAAAEIVIDGIFRIPVAQWPGLPAAPPAGYLACGVTGGIEVTAPDGTRMLCAAGPGAVAEPPDDVAPYDIALLDLLGDPAQLGRLRRRGLVTDATSVAAIHIDHRLTSERELARRCGLWGLTPAGDSDHLRPGATGRPSPRPRPWRTLVLGGARSGKSAEAELRLAAEPDVTYLAAGGPAAREDTRWAARVAAHRARRPRWWRTVETTDIAPQVRACSGAVLIDGIGTWLAALLEQAGAWRRPPDDHLVARRVAAGIRDLAAAWRETAAYVVAVSDEAGSGVVPAAESGRVFRDELGSLNQLLAAESEETVLVVAGSVLSLPG